MSLDLSAAFDNINHNLLLRKLKAYGLGDSSLRLLNTYLSDRKNYLRLNGKKSKCWYGTSKGIPQGSQLGPLIWNIYINDFIIFVRSYAVHVVAYADDLTLWVVDHTASDIQKKLTSIVPIILTWFEENKLTINPRKFQLMGLGRNIDELSLIIDGSRITCQNMITLLGVDIDPRFHYEFHTKKTIRTIAWKLCGVNRLKRIVNRKVRWRLIQTYIIPHFEYASSLLIFSSASSQRRLECMYERCIRHALRDYTAPLRELQIRVNTNTLKEKWHLSLFRLMKSIETTMRNARDTTISEFLEKYQCIPGHAPIIFLQLFSEAPTEARRNIFHQPKCCTKTFGQNSVRYFGTSFWNKIPSDTRSYHQRSQKALQAVQKLLKQTTGVNNF